MADGLTRARHTLKHQRKEREQPPAPFPAYSPGDLLSPSGAGQPFKRGMVSMPDAAAERGHLTATTLAENFQVTAPIPLAPICEPLRTVPLSAWDKRTVADLLDCDQYQKA